MAGDFKPYRCYEYDIDDGTYESQGLDSQEDGEEDSSQLGSDDLDQDQDDDAYSPCIQAFVDVAQAIATHIDNICTSPPQGIFSPKSSLCSMLATQSALRL
jgi:hypothetical protein